MRAKYLWAMLLAAPLAIGGLVYAGAQASADVPSDDARFVCPITGEELPCENCCPLKWRFRPRRPQKALATTAVARASESRLLGTLCPRFD
jgi:hypothetical protein